MKKLALITLAILAVLSVVLSVSAADKGSSPQVTLTPVRVFEMVQDKNGDMVEHCLIKGNINRKNERIYHCPRWRDYDKTVIDEDKGERWFCTEAEALEAGWRAPKYDTGPCW